MSFTRNISIYAAADVLGAGIGLITSPISTRLLTQDQFGALPLLAAVWAVIALLQYAGMDWALPFFRSQNQYDSGRVLVVATTIAGLGGLLVWALFFAVNIMNPWLREYAEVSALELSLFLVGILPSSLLNWYLFILRYENQAMAFARISLFGRTLSTVLALPAMALVSQDWRLIVYFGMGSLVSLIAVVWALRELRLLQLDLYSKTNWTRGMAKKMLSYGLILVPGGMVYSITTVVDRLLVGWFLGPQSNALLALTTAIGGVALLLKIWFARAWDPKMVDWLKSKDSEIYLPRLQIGISMLMLGMLPIPLLAMIWLEPVIHLLYPSQYAKVASLIPAMISSGVISTFSLVAVATVMIANTAKWHFPIYSIALLLNVVAAILLIPVLGVLGAIVGTLLAETFILVAWIFLGIRVYGNLCLRWGYCLFMLGLVVLISSLYSPGMLLPHAVFAERIFLSLVLALAWLTCWIYIKPIRLLRTLKTIATPD